MTAIRHRASPEFIGSRNCIPMSFTAESAWHGASEPQGSPERVLPWQVTMDRLIFAPLSHTHFWYGVGMLKVPPACFVLTHTFSVLYFLLEKQRWHNQSFIGLLAPCRRTLCSVAIGTQMHDSINSGLLTRWRMAVLNEKTDAAAELGGIP